MNRDAVSPALGVVLMVCITLVLTSVIAAFVFGVVGSEYTRKNVTIAATCEITATTVKVTTTDNETYIVRGLGGVSYKKYPIVGYTYNVTISGYDIVDYFPKVAALPTSPMPCGACIK